MTQGYRKAEKEEVQLALQLTIDALTAEGVLNEKTTQFVFPPNGTAPTLSKQLLAKLSSRLGDCGHLSPRASFVVLNLGVNKLMKGDLFVVTGESRISTHKDLRAKGLAGAPLPVFRKGLRVSP